MQEAQARKSLSVSCEGNISKEDVLLSSLCRNGVHVMDSSCVKSPKLHGGSTLIVEGQFQPPH